ncbi:MAG: hypothetical protein ACYDH3_06815 [Candidatus Aminicenantales bacterium]
MVVSFKVDRGNIFTIDGPFSQTFAFWEQSPFGGVGPRFIPDFPEKIEKNRQPKRGLLRAIFISF